MTSGGVRRGQHRGATFQRGDHSALGDADALLLHRFQQRVLFVAYFIEFVDAAHALVGQNQRASFDAQLPATFTIK